MPPVDTIAGPDNPDQGLVSDPRQVKRRPGLDDRPNPDFSHIIFANCCSAHEFG